MSWEIVLLYVPGRLPDAQRIRSHAKIPIDASLDLSEDSHAINQHVPK
jgi:hypothetical protein